VLPLAILALVMLVRLRGLDKARPLRGARRVALPVVCTVLVAAMLVILPPTAIGWSWFAGGALLGAGVGWQRARLMRLHFDPDSGQVMIRQSPAALILLMVVAGLRRLIRPPAGLATSHAAIAGSALLLTIGLTGFALGMIVTQRAELWRRARMLRGEPS
jgi:hypothetical protein